MFENIARNIVMFKNSCPFTRIKIRENLEVIRTKVVIDKNPESFWMSHFRRQKSRFFKNTAM